MPDYPKAMKLEDVYKSISPEPLVNKSQFEAYYRPEINELRGNDRISLMALELQRSFGGLPYKAFLMGHSGVGKSTELTRLVNEVENRYSAIRFSATTVLDPISFQPFDVLLYMMGTVAEATAAPIEKGGAGKKPSDERVKELWNWFATEKETITKATEKGAQLAGGAGVEGGSWWAKLLGLNASVKGEIKFASTRENATVTYRLSRLSDLIELANRLLDECNKLLKETVGREWLLIGEDFDKAGLSPDCTEKLFVTYGNVFKSLRAHMIFVVPIALAYSDKANQFPVPSDRRHCLPDTPVFEKDHSPHKKGREAVRKVLEARMSVDLLAKGQLERLIVASGGNLRDLFALVSAASNLALLRKQPDARIEKADLDSAINDLRTEYQRQLGESLYDPKPIPYEEKAERLVRIYKGKPEAEVTDPVLYSLLRSRAVQEFDGERWFGIHPLVVDILVSHKRLRRSAKGTLPGGTH